MIPPHKKEATTKAVTPHTMKHYNLIRIDKSFTKANLLKSVDGRLISCFLSKNQVKKLSNIGLCLFM